MQLTREYTMKESLVSRIIAHGDSQTYGYFLTEENNGYGNGPNSSAWPTLVSDYYNVDVVNNGVCGASNKEIWLEAINFNYQLGDLVCILWSFFDREFFPSGNTRDNIVGFDGHYEGIKLIPNFYNDKKNKLYYKDFHSNFNSLVSFSLYKTHLAMHLTSLNIPFVFKNLQVPNIPRRSFDWDSIECKGINYILDDFGYDNSHYGIESHKTVANNFIEDINEKIS